MDKILSKDTIKNVFSALGAKTSDSNYGVALLDKTSGEPKGFMGMSDLASVLGGVVNEEIPNNNCNDAVQTGTYQTWGSIQNTPHGTSTALYRLEVLRREFPGDLVIIDQSLMSTTERWERQNWGGSWSDWVRVDNFGCSTPEALATLLGGQFKHINGTFNIDEFFEEKFQFMLCTPSSVTGTMPSFSRTDRFFLLHYGGGPTIASYHLQVIWSCLQNRMFSRSTLEGAWLPWKEFQTV